MPNKDTIIYKDHYPRVAANLDREHGKNKWQARKKDSGIGYDIIVTEDLARAIFGEIYDSYTEEKRAEDIEKAGDLEYIDIDRDGFVWLRLTESQALQCFISGLFQVYWLFDDGTESLIDAVRQIIKAYESGEVCALEVGYVDPFIAMNM